MADELRGKVALVTGSSQGIGRGIALELAQAGCDIVLTGRGEAKLKAVAAEDRVDSVVKPSFTLPISLQPAEPGRLARRRWSAPSVVSIFWCAMLDRPGAAIFSAWVTTPGTMDLR